MCKFLFQDILEKPAFRSFFKLGSEFDSNFVYEVAFGFLPRQFKATAEDRYLYKEEGDVTEIYFITKGEWAIAFNSFSADVQIDEDDDEMKGPPDMIKSGIYIASRRINFGYIGDYYVFSSKRSQYSYVALTDVESFALTKQFMFKTIFKKFPGLHSELLAESFSRYLKDFRKPCGKKRTETIIKLNKKRVYSSTNLDNAVNSPQRQVIKAMRGAGNNKLKRKNSRTKIFEKQEELMQYKNQLDVLNDKANTMFEHMKQINRIVNKKIMEIENAVTRSETIFVDEINNLIKLKANIAKQ